MKYSKIREESLKNKVGVDWFGTFDTTEILGDIDFTVFPKQDNIFGRTPLLWAEAKTGDFDVSTMFVQLVLTIGKARTFDKVLPPAFLGAFDFKKIAFVSYISIQDIFYLNDFNWNVTPSNHESKEFKLIKERIESILKKNSYIYDYQTDEKELKLFIANNIAKATEANKIKIDKNNYIPIYLRWVDIVKPVIDVNWDDLKKSNIFDRDFYLADLFVDDRDTNKIDDDLSIRENLFVLFQNQGYKISRENLNQAFDASINIKNKDVYQQFWKRYKRPPLKEYQEYIIERTDLLVPQDIRERKGAFFTPRVWVELSQKYISDYLGDDWQDEYYIWDCASGTGNLLAGLRNKYNIWASTLDQSDVKVMHERIHHGANLLENHVFQFDFLNDDFAKLPKGLQDIINDPKKRKRLIIYINPPYAEAGNAKQKSGTGENKPKTATENKTYTKYKNQIGKASNELFIQFLTRIYFEIPNCLIANFSKLKNLQSSNFKQFRDVFKPKLDKIFLVPADTFDNVKGQFPISFSIWDTSKQERFDNINADVYDKDSIQLENKLIISYDNELGKINDWLKSLSKNKNQILIIGNIHSNGNDFQHQNDVFIDNDLNKKSFGGLHLKISESNLIEASIVLAVRHCIEADWLNDRDQFLNPNEIWKSDKEFHNDCLIYTLFTNNIQTKYGTNHWIPFTAKEVNAQEKFESDFMSDFISGKIKFDKKTEASLFGDKLDIEINDGKPRKFSALATAVFDAGRELWKYYHAQKGVNVNASLYDIREYFQGRNDKGKMNNKSEDETYMRLISDLRQKLKVLAQKIEPKVYEYGFLKI